MKRKKLIILGLCLSFIYSSCSDELEQIPQLSEEAKFENFGIADARFYFEENATDLAPLRFADEKPTKSVDPPAFELIPEWNNALEAGHRGVRLIEVPIHSNTINLYVESVVKSGKMIYQKRAFTQRRLVIARRNTGETDMFIITLVPSQTADGNIEKSLQNFRYLGGGDFTGRVFCSTLDGKFVKAFGYSNGQLQGQLFVIKRSELAHYVEENEMNDYSTIKLHEGFRTKAGTYAFNEGGGVSSGYCPHGYPEGSCPHYGCNDEVVVVGCPDCGATNGCWCSRCFYCGNKESRCSCTRCTRCHNKMPECTCYLYPDPGTGGGSGGGTGGGGSGGSGGGTSPGTGGTTSTLDKICSKNTTLTSTQKNQIEEGINTLKTTYPKASALFSKLESSNVQITIAIDPDMPKGTVKYNHSTHTLTFLGSQYGASFGALEDWTHVAQCEVYYKSNIPSNRTLEFEAKMFCDLNCAIRGIDACSALGFGFEKNIDLLVKYNEFKEYVSTNTKISDYLNEYYILGEGWDDPNYQSGTFQKQFPELLDDLFK